jgi:hypothetical protein
LKIFNQPVGHRSESLAEKAALAQFVRSKGGTVFHPSGTCRMGQNADAVVDLQLRVRSRAAARDRCLGDADHDLGQHQCVGADDW